MTPNPGTQGKDLNRDVQNWPTPRAEDSEQVGNHTNPNSHPGDSLGGKARQWPTPSALGSQGETSADLERRGSKLVNRKTGRVLQTNLSTEAKLWSTPKTPTGGPETRASKAKRGAGGEDLETQASLWATPAAANIRDGKTSDECFEKNSRPLQEQAYQFGRQVQTSVTDGGRSSGDGRKLNPLFDEWLIGWPLGWTCPHRLPGPDASETTAFALWETGSIRVLRLWLSAYWRSGLESGGSSGSAKKPS